MFPSQGSGPSARDVLAEALKLKDRLEREGLDVEPKFSEVWVVLHFLYQKLGDAAEVERCLRKLQTYSTFPGYQKALKNVGLS
jgi:hypothetical protein